MFLVRLARGTVTDFRGWLASRSVFLVEFLASFSNSAILLTTAACLAAASAFLAAAAALASWTSVVERRV